MADDIKIDYDERLEEKETGLAYCVEIDGDIHFFPKSLCRIYGSKKGIYVPEWLAIKNDLI